MTSLNGREFADCNHDHRAPKDEIISLPVSQSGIGRHRCPICAYAKGYEEGFAQAVRTLENAQRLATKFINHELDPMTENLLRLDQEEQ